MPSPERNIKETNDTIESFIDLLDNVNQFIDGVYNDLDVSRPRRFSIENTTTNSIIRSLGDSPSSSRTYRTPPRNLRFGSSGENRMPQVSLVRRRNMDADIENIDRICDNAERNLRSIGLSMYNSSSDSISEDTSNENLSNSSSTITHQLPEITLNPTSPVLSTIIGNLNIENSSHRPRTLSVSSPSVPVVDLSDSVVRTPERAQNNNEDDDDDVVLVSYDNSSVVDLCTPGSQYSTPRAIRNHNTKMLNRRHLPHEVEIVDTCCGGPVSAKRRCSGTTEYKSLVADNKSALRPPPTNGSMPFVCPVCFESCLQREPTSTKCGHVFCKECIEQAILLAHKCPLCNKKISKKQTFRIYL